MRVIRDPILGPAREPHEARRDLDELLAFGTHFVALVSDEDLD